MIINNTKTLNGYKYMFNKLMKDARKKHFLSQRRMAVKLKITDKAVSKYETYENMPSIDVVLRFFRKFEYKLTLENSKGQKIEYLFSPQRKKK